MIRCRRQDRAVHLFAVKDCWIARKWSGKFNKSAKNPQAWTQGLVSGFVPGSLCHRVKELPEGNLAGFAKFFVQRGLDTP